MGTMRKEETGPPKMMRLGSHIGFQKNDPAERGVSCGKKRRVRYRPLKFWSSHLTASRGHRSTFAH